MGLALGPAGGFGRGGAPSVSLLYIACMLHRPRKYTWHQQLTLPMADIEHAGHQFLQQYSAAASIGSHRVG
eukprot:4593136-Karenia_brevis.AAC.1